MALKIFEVEEENKIVKLWYAADIVRFSSIVYNSISYLDLSISENFKNRSIRSKGIILKHSIEFVNTEEKCQHIFHSCRNILYTLHLDLSKKRENSLKEYIDERSRYLLSTYSRFPQIAGLEVWSSFFITTLYIITCDALEVNVEKLTLLRLILKIPELKEMFFCYGMADILDSCVDFFYPKIIDLELFECFIKSFSIADWIYRNESAEILHFLLYYTRKFGRDELVHESWTTISELSTYCIFWGSFLNIGSILKYVDNPGVSLDDGSMLFESSSLGELPVDEIIEKSSKWMNLERAHLLLITLPIFDQRNQTPQRHEDASEALRLLWSCSTQAYMTLKDVERTFAGTHSPAVLADMYEFYCSSIGEDHSFIETRPLTHFCRATIRKSLYRNKIWIPEGVGLLPLPKCLQSFLNLEKQFVPEL